MTPNHAPITQEQFDRIVNSTGWSIEEMPLDVIADIPKIVRPNDILGGFISGSLEQPKILNQHPSIAAFEILVFEKNPKPEWNEGPVNAYHYVVRRSGNPTHPYILSGPYIGDTIIGHHPSGLNLEVYDQHKEPMTPRPISTLGTSTVEHSLMPSVVTNHNTK